MRAPGLRTEQVEPDGAGFEAAWWELWRRVPDATPFTSPAWLGPWWAVFRPGESRTVAVWDGARLVALAPLYREDGPYGRRVLPLGIGISDVFDLLADPAVPAAGEALAAALGDLARDADALSLEELPDGARALALACPPGLADETGRQSPRPLLSLRIEGEEALACVPSARRRKVRMSQHRVARRGGAVERVGPGQEDGFLDDLAALHGRRWQARGEAGVLADPLVRRFHRAALPRLADAGLARLSRLRIEGRVAAAYYGLAHRATAHAYLGGFDPDFGFESPGTALLADAIAEAARAGCTTFDFLRGAEPYKYGWGAQDSWNSRRAWRPA